MMAFAKKDEGVAVVKRANFITAEVTIRSTAPMVQNAFPIKAKLQMMAAMTASKSEKSKAKSERPPRDYDDEFVQAQHLDAKGRNGIPAPAFRCAMIDACRAAGIVMTRAKMSVFVEHDTIDADDGKPLVLFDAPPPIRTEMLVRNDNGSADIRIRPMWPEWSAKLRITFDADMISLDSVVNLLDRAGRQVGICEGRPFSKNSTGQGWGTFTVEQEGS